MFPRQEQQQSFFKDLWAELTVKKRTEVMQYVKKIYDVLKEGLQLSSEPASS